MFFLGTCFVAYFIGQEYGESYGWCAFGVGLMLSAITFELE
jgi:hypothetical protein